MEVCNARVRFHRGQVIAWFRDVGDDSQLFPWPLRILREIVRALVGPVQILRSRRAEIFGTVRRLSGRAWVERRDRFGYAGIGNTARLFRATGAVVTKLNVPTGSLHRCLDDFAHGAPGARPASAAEYWFLDRVAGLLVRW